MQKIIKKIPKMLKNSKKCKKLLKMLNNSKKFSNLLKGMLENLKMLKVPKIILMLKSAKNTKKC